MERNVANDPAAAREMITKTGQNGVPVIEIDGQIIVGFDKNRLENIIASQQSKRRASLGAKVADARSIAARTPGLTASEGAYVGGIRPGSPAERAGLRVGDVIVGLADKPVRTAGDVEHLISRLSQNSTVRIRILRNGEILNLIATL